MNAPTNTCGEFTSLARAIAASKGVMQPAAALLDAQGCYRAARICKSAIGVGSLSDPTWAGPLADYKPLASGFIESLRPISAFDSMLPLMRRMPLRTRIGLVTLGASGSGVSEGSPKPISRLTLAGVHLEPRKASCILVVTDELAAFAEAAAMSLFSRELRGAVSTATNWIFLPGITAGATSIGSSGGSSQQIYADLSALVELVSVTGTSQLVLVVSPIDAARLSLKTTPDGLLAFPDMQPSGGSIAGIRVVVSDALASETAGTAALLDADAIAAGDDTITLSGSAQTSLQMDDAPVDGAAVMTSLFQTNSRALRAERYFGFELLRASGVALLTGTSWANESIT